VLAFFGLYEYFNHGSNRLSFLATVFFMATAFNGDLNQWDVAKVTYMSGSKLLIPTRLFQNSWKFGVGGEEVMQRHA
jgi:surface protein